MNNIILTAFENKCPLNNFNFLTFKIKNTAIPNNKVINMHILHVHSISCKIEICPCLITALMSFFAVKQDWLPMILTWYVYIL